ncbi:LysR family transcriptional regulator [Nioella aestuarii]|uniref:LysR family transcriptional regulator n=1 Tax=Nioella aestuarii TaxID=1662864 RepID=UPI003D7F81C9
MNIKSLDLNLLKVLDALLHEGSVTRAAAAVGLSQPAASAALGRLRSALGDPLFVRQGQRLVATEFAQGLAQPLRAHLEGLEAVLTPLGDFHPEHADDTFRLAGVGFFAEMLMPQLAQVLSERAPNMRAQLVDLVAENYVSTLVRADIDLAFFPMVQMPDWVARQALFHSPFKLIARKGHDRLKRAGVAPGNVIPIDLFCELGHVLFSVEGKFESFGDEALRRVGRRRKVVMTMNSFPGIMRTVAASDLVALVPVQLADSMAADYGLDSYAAPLDLPVPLLGMMWHKRQSTTPAHRWFRGVVADILQPLNAGFATLPKD